VTHRAAAAAAGLLLPCSWLQGRLLRLHTRGKSCFHASSSVLMRRAQQQQKQKRASSKSPLLLLRAAPATASPLLLHQA
jgi:hypothetical protein